MDNLERMNRVVSLLEEVKKNSTSLSQTDQLVVSRLYSDGRYLEKKLALIREDKKEIFEKNRQTGGKNKSMEELLSSYYDTIHEEKHNQN